MTGVVDSVIGADKEIAVERFLTNLRIPFSLAEGECALCGVILDADERTGPLPVHPPYTRLSNPGGKYTRRLSRCPA